MIKKTETKNYASGCWVYLRSEPGLWTVGFYDPQGKWQTDSDHSERESAAERVHYLNGGGKDAPPEFYYGPRPGYE